MQRKHRDPWGLAETKDRLKIETARSELRCRLTLNGRRVARRHKCDVLVLALNALVRKSHHTATARFTTLVRCVTTIAIARTWPRACLLFQCVLVVERNQRIGRPHRSLDVLTIRSHLSTSDIAGGSEITVVITTMRQGGPPEMFKLHNPSNVRFSQGFRTRFVYSNLILWEMKHRDSAMPCPRPRNDVQGDSRQRCGQFLPRASC
jgi:hypothetical protein